MIRFRGKRAPVALRAFARWLEAEIGIVHPLDVHLVSSLDGFFEAPGRTSGFHPYMIVALQNDPVTTIAHEAVHYEQWRDKRPVNERGVDQRAEALVRRWKREAA